MKLVCGTDFSAAAAASAKVAAVLARRTGAGLVLVHVIEPWVGAALTPEMAGAAPLFDESQRRAAERELENLAAELSQGSPRLSVETRLVVGVPHAVLGDTARELSASMVVVGSHGHRAAWRWVLGSVAERTAQTSSVPTLVVKDGAQLAEALRAGRPLRLVVAIDSTSASDAAIAWVKGMRGTIDADVRFLNLYWPPEQYARLGLDGRELFASDPEVVNVLKRELRERLGALAGAGQLEVSVQPCWGRYGDAIALYAEESQADLVVLGAHQRRGLSRLSHDSTSRQVLHAARASIVCVPSGGAAVEQPIPELRRVLCATDFSEAGARAVPEAYAVLRSGGIVDLVHVLPRITDEAARRSKEQEALRRLQEVVPREAEALGVMTRLHVVHGEPAAAICQTATRLGVDLVCMGSHDKGKLSEVVLGSVSSAVLKKAPCPVLVVRAQRS